MSTETQEQQAVGFAIQRLYVKDISLETPHSPSIFLQTWEPEINLDLDIKSERLEDDHYEVTLMVTATAKVKDQVAFLVEVKQAGIFGISQLEDDQLQHALGAFCPTILYPYAREVVSDLTTRAGFPPLYLNPVNFDMLYAERLQQQTAANDAPASKEEVES